MLQQTLQDRRENRERVRLITDRRPANIHFQGLPLSQAFPPWSPESISELSPVSLSSTDSDRSDASAVDRDPGSPGLLGLAEDLAASNLSLKEIARDLGKVLGRVASLRGKRVLRPAQQRLSSSFRVGVGQAGGGREEEHLEQVDRRRFFVYFERLWRTRLGLGESPDDGWRRSVASEEFYDASEEEQNSSDFEGTPFDSEW